MKFDKSLHGVRSCVYQIISRNDNKFYIGVTACLLVGRLNHHFWELRKNRHSNPYLQHSFNLHGEDNFYINILEKDIPKEMLNEKEIFYIAKLNALDRSVAYNILAGGIIKVHSQESIDKLRKTHIERYGKKEGRVHFNTGKKRSPETIDKIRAALLLRNPVVHTEESKRKISIANKGKKRTQEQIAYSKNCRLKKAPHENKHARPVFMYDENGNLLKKFACVLYAGESLGINVGFAGQICRGVRKSSNGIILKYS